MKLRGGVKVANSHEAMFGLAGFDISTLSPELTDHLWHVGVHTKQGVQINIGFVIQKDESKFAEIILNNYTPILLLHGSGYEFSNELMSQLSALPSAQRSFYDGEVFFVIASIPDKLLSDKSIKKK